MEAQVSGQRLHIRLFLEGIEVPVVAAQVQMSINAPATASIQVVPSDRVLELKARTMVHLFFWDAAEGLFDPGFNSKAAVNQPADNFKVDENDPTQQSENTAVAEFEQDQELYGYKLLFSGEMIGVSLVKTPMGRQAVLQCADFSTYWDTTYQVMISFGPNGNFLWNSSAMWAGGSSMFNDILGGHGMVLGEYLRRSPRTAGMEKIGGLMGGIISLLEAMGGVPEHVHGVNDFFTIAELKNHILAQIAAEENDDTALHLFNAKTFWQWLQGSAMSLGELVTFRDMMKMLFNYIYYEVVPNPAALYVPSEESRVTGKKAWSSTTDTNKDMSAQSKDKLREMFKKAMRMAETPGKAVRGENLDSGRDPMVQGVASPNSPYVNEYILMREPVPEEGQQAQDMSSDIKKILEDDIPPDTIFPQVVKDLESARRALNNIRDTEGYEGQPLFNLIYTNIKWWAKVVFYLNRAIGGGLRTRRGVKTLRSKAKSDRLLTQIFRPDCFFASPPMCNVLFPEQYTQFTYSRSFLQEVSRLRLQVSNWITGGAGGILGQYCYAPSLKDLRAQAKAQGNNSIRGLLPWEKYAGILPKFEQISEVNFVASRVQRQVNKGKAVQDEPGKSKGADPKATKQKGDIKGQANSFAQRAANFNFMKYRFAARTADVQARFDPYLVVGFPALIISQPWLPDPKEVLDALAKAEKVYGLSNQGIGYSIQNGNSVEVPTPVSSNDLFSRIDFVAQELKAPTHYLGMIAGLSHSVDQKGGSTSATMTHCRSHRAYEDEFLGALSTAVNTEKIDIPYDTELDLDDLIQKGDWKLLKYLLDVTPQNIPEQMTELKNEQMMPPPLASDAARLEERPGQASSLPVHSTVEPFLLFTAPLTGPTAEGGSVVEDVGTASLRGRVKIGTIHGTNIYALEPDVPPEKALVGKKGPKGGVVTQVTLTSDAVGTYTGAELNPRFYTYETVIIGKSDPAKLKFDSQGNVIDSNVSFIDEFVKQKKGRFSSAKKYYFWKKAVIHETVTKKRNYVRKIPIEEAIRPSWFSPLYSSFFIGDEIYQKFFGCGAITDRSAFKYGEDTGVFGTNKAVAQDLTTKIQAAAGDLNQVRKILDDAKASSLIDIPDVETSIDALAYTYGEVKRMGLDVHNFVYDYVWRPIASLYNILGSADLQYEVGADQKSLNKVKGVQGFHSTAVAALEDLIGLLKDPDLELPRIVESGKRVSICKDLDPRPGRRAAVESYADDLLMKIGSLPGASGSLGVGLRG